MLKTLGVSACASSLPLTGYLAVLLFHPQRQAGQPKVQPSAAHFTLARAAHLPPPSAPCPHLSHHPSAQGPLPQAPRRCAIAPQRSSWRRRPPPPPASVCRRRRWPGSVGNAHEPQAAGGEGVRMSCRQRGLHTSCRQRALRRLDTSTSRHWQAPR